MTYGGVIAESALCTMWLLVTLPIPGYAQESTDPLELRRATATITIDGRVTESEWGEIPVLPVTMVEPDPGNPPSERTEIRVAYDDNYFYASARMWDSRPVRPRSLTRDRWTNDDTFEIILDTLNDNENAMKFMVMPSGARQDALIWKDVEYQGDEWNNESWNTIWDAATTVTADGWFAEMRVPFASLRLRPQDGCTVMGLIAFRYIVRRNEIITFPTLPPNRRLAWFKPSLARDVSLAWVDVERPIYVTPYALAGTSTREAGVDAKLGVGDNLTLDVTVNTDFAQVESDEEQLNLTRYSLFLPERRPFFLERESLFEFNTGGNTGLFYSRRVGLSDDGVPGRIYGGARLTGRLGAWDLGAMSLQTSAGTGALTSDAENASVVRVRRQTSAQSYVGGIAVTRSGSMRPANAAYGLDTQIHLGGPTFLTAMWAQTPGERGGIGSSGLARVRMERRIREGWGYAADLRWFGRSFEPGLGFVEARNVTSATGKVSHGTRRKSGPLLFYSFGLWSGLARRNSDHTLEYGYADGAFIYEVRSGHSGDISQWNRSEQLIEPFELAPGVSVPPGQYTWHRVSTSFATRPGPPVRIFTSAEAGGFYDGASVAAAIAPTWTLGRHLELSTRYGFTRVRFDTRDEGFDSHIAQVRARIGFTIKASVMTYAQYNNLRNAVTLNFRFRYAFRDGTDLYVVLDDGIDTSDVRPAGRQPWDRRTFAIKYARTLIF